MDDTEPLDHARNELRLRLPSLPTAKDTIEFASKFLKRTIPQAEYWITNRHRWMHSIPTEECDVVITFPIGVEDVTLMWLLAQLRLSGLSVRVRPNATTDCYQCYLTAPSNVLLKCAEEHHLPKRLTAEYGGGLKEFVRSEENKFEGIDNELEFFTTQQRQWLILRLLESMRAKAGDQVGNVQFIEGQAIIPKCLSRGIIAQIYPVHEIPALKYLRKTWVRSVFNRQPIDDIEEYFGVKITMYFAWLGHYTTALTIPALVGFIFWTISFWRLDQSVADIGFVMFSFFNVIWFSVYLEAWKRYCAELAYKWGTLDQRDELLVEPRPLFRGTLEISPVTGRLEPRYPAWKRNVFRYFVSVPVICVCVSIVIGIMIVSFRLQDWWDKEIVRRSYFQCFTFVPKILLGIVISCLDEMYYKVARWLNDIENYRLDREYENNLIIKVATFQFVNSFISLFYIAFYLQDQERLKVQLAVLLITRQIIQNIKESALPYLIEQFRLAKLSFDLFGALSPSVVKEKKKFGESVKTSKDKQARFSEGRTIPQAEVESTLFKYEGTFSEHLEMFIQLGYVVLFSSAFPMAAFCAFINNLLEIRSDAFKMCFIYQRPFGERVSNIGMWLNTMEVMGLVAVLVNCALIGLSGQVHRMFPDMSKTQTVLLIVALEHITLLVRFLISCLIPDMPEWVATEMAKVEFSRREAVNRVSSVTTTPPSSSTGGTAILVDRVGDIVTDMTHPDDECEELASPNTEVAESDSADDSYSITTKDRPPSVESDLSQSIDNIDRILLNIDEAPETPPPLKRDLSRDSESSGECVENLQKAVLMRRGVDQEWAASTSEHLDKRDEKGAWYKNVNARRLIDKSFPCRSTSCLMSAQKESSASSSTESCGVTPTPSTSSPTTSAGSSAENSDPSEKRRRLRSTLIKRARSVAVFSLKLKERRAKAEPPPEIPEQPPMPKPHVGGELSYLPIEMLIQVEDVVPQRNSRANTPTGPK